MQTLLAFIDINSSLTLTEFVSLIAKYKSFDSKPKVDLSRYTPAQIEALKKVQKEQAQTNTVIGVSFTKEFNEFKCHSFEYIMQLYSLYKKGVMPFPGSPSEQPNKIIEAFNVIQAVEAEDQLKEQKKQALIQKRNNRK